MKKVIMNKYTILLLFAIFFVLLFSYSTLYNIGSGDSSIFLTIGKFWSDGKIPYVDLFDHKGPLIFFISMLGYKIFGCAQGVLLFQFVSMFFSFYLLEKIAFLELKNKKKSVFLTFLTLCFLPILYGEGNLTEEYCLPFITCCMYLNLKFLNAYIKSKKINHKRIYSFIYGISLSVCFLTRLTNCISILIGMGIIYIIFLKEKKIKMLLGSVFFTILGFLTLFLPFAIYFLSKNCFFDFIYGTLLYNLDYVSNLFSWVHNEYILIYIGIYIVCFFPSYIIFIIGILKFRKEKNFKFIFYMLLGLCENILFLTGNLYPHYSMITLPNFVIALCEMENYFRKNKNIFYVPIVLFFYCCCFAYAFDFDDKLKNENYKIDEFISHLDNKDSFIAVNLDDYKSIYINNDIVPFYKYFVLQDWQASNSNKMKLELVNKFEKGNVKYILIQNEMASVIYDLLLKKYDYKDSIKVDENVISLYELKKEFN